MIVTADLLALPKELSPHGPRIHDVLHSPDVWHTLLGAEVSIHIPVLLVKVSKQIHEEIVDDIRLVAFSQCVQVQSGGLQLTSTKFSEFRKFECLAKSGQLQQRQKTLRRGVCEGEVQHLP